MNLIDINEIEAAIFDMDGTLLDSMQVWHNFASDYVKRLGIEPNESISQRLYTMSIIDSAMFLKNEFSLNKSAEVIVDEINDMVKNQYFYHLLPKENVMNVLKKYKNEGIKMCVATATDRFLAEAAINRLNMNEYFDFIITCTEVKASKTLPVIYEEALKKLKTSKDKTYVFEDAYFAAISAKKAGFKVVGVMDEASKKFQDILKETSDYYIKSFYEL